MNDFLTLKETAEILGIPATAVKKDLLERGRIAYKKVGGRYQISRESIASWAELYDCPNLNRGMRTSIRARLFPEA